MKTILMQLPLLLLIAAAGEDLSAACGDGTYFDAALQKCVRSEDRTEDPDVITLAGIYDTTGYEWAGDVFAVTVDLINRGHWDVLPHGTRLEYSLGNSACDENTALQQYWKTRRENGNLPVHGVIGARCSGVSMALCRLLQLDNVPLLSPASSSPLLSNEREYPLFSRMVAPKDERGEVGAVVAMLKELGWSRVGILETNTQYSKDAANAFSKSWVGDGGREAFRKTIDLTPDGEVDEASVHLALRHIQTTESESSSRVILLVGHVEHSFPILKTATESGLVMDDTIWVGLSSWVARSDGSHLDDGKWLPEVPGYIGLSLFRDNTNEQYKHFLAELQSYQRSKGINPLPELPIFARETVDAIRALATAIAQADDRRDGQEIVRKLRSLKLDDGVSGKIEFTPEGDRKNPQYSIYNAISSVGGAIEWKAVGTVGTKAGSVAWTDGLQSVCFASVGCGFSTVPDDTRPYKLPWWGIFLICFLAIVSVAFASYVVLSRRYQVKLMERYQASLRARLLPESVVSVSKAEKKYIPYIPRTQDDQDVEMAIDRFTGKSLSVAPVKNVQWMWSETRCQMGEHDTNTVFGDPNDCWVLYPPAATRKIEEARLLGLKEVSPLADYMINFQRMQQTNLDTGYVRDVQRVISVEPDDGDQTVRTISLSDVEVGSRIPADLEGEPRMVLIDGDIVQISSQFEGWCFGTKLYHADEAAARELILFALDGLGPDEGQVFLDSGWFELDKTRTATSEDLAVLQPNIGQQGDLDPPEHWDPVTDATAVKRFQLLAGDPERYDVEAAFARSLPAARVLKVERIQNLALWQSFAVKRQTMRRRVTGNTRNFELERSWLFHGTTADVLDRILQQGFNRAFSGKHATLFGKGVYFARNADFSANYATKDYRGRQFIIASRVVVGAYCQGKPDALTPDVRDHETLELFDSTVNRMDNPSIFVAYHDAQAYPEYVITFRMD